MMSTLNGQRGLPRPSVIQLAFKDLPSLAASYMPLLSNGGLFVPTERGFQLGESIYVLLTLPDDPQRYPIAAKVAWVTPARSAGGRVQGVGMHFPTDDKTLQLRTKIEATLNSYVGSDRSSQTV